MLATEGGGGGHELSERRAAPNNGKSMNDFSHAFHGGPGGEPALKTYTFEDVVAGLNSVAPYDWTRFLRTRLDSLAPKTPEEAMLASGWQMIYNDQPNEYERVRDVVQKQANLMYSIGLVAKDDGTLVTVLYGGPSFKAGLGPGMKITEVAGQKFTLDALRSAVTASTTTRCSAEGRKRPAGRGLHDRLSRWREVPPFAARAESPRSARRDPASALAVNRAVTSRKFGIRRRHHDREQTNDPCIAIAIVVALSA